MTWTRSSNSMFLGVCSGLAKKFNIQVSLLRLLWFVSVFFVGFGLLAYICLAIALPREDREFEAREPKILGVAYRLSRHSDIEIGLLRFMFLFFTFFSSGLVILVYLALHFILKPTLDDYR